MAVFYVLLFVPIIMQHFVVKKGHIDYEKKNKNALTFFFVALTVLVALRHKMIGNDTVNYIYYFKKIGSLNWDAVRDIELEIGFSYFNKIVSVFTKEPQFFLIITALITAVMIYPTYKRLCVDASLTIVLFCTMSTFVMMFSGIRQMISIGLGFIAYEFMRNKKRIPYVIAVVLAMLFHSSAFMLFFLYPVYYLKITKKHMYWMIPALVTVFIFNRQIFFVMISVLSRFTRFEGKIISTGAFTMLLLFLIFVLFAFLVPDESALDEETIGLRNFLLLSLLLQMFAPLHALAMRMNYYYIIFIPLLIPKIIACHNERWGQIAIVGRHIMVVFFAVYFFVNAGIDQNLNVFPYHFFWEAVG